MISINTRETVYREEVIDNKKIEYIKTESEYDLFEHIQVTCYERHNLEDGDIVTITRYTKYGDYRTDVTVTVVDDFTYRFKKLPDISVNIESVEDEVLDYRILTTGNRAVNVLKLGLSKEHTFFNNPSLGIINIKGNIPSIYYNRNYRVDKPLTKWCGGGHVLCNGFLYDINGYDESSYKYIFDGDYLNNDTPVLYYLDIDGNKVYVGGGKIGDKTVPSVEIDDFGNINKYNSCNIVNEKGYGMVVVPVLYTGDDDLSMLYLCYSPETCSGVASYIKENYSGMTLMYEDNTYYTINYEDNTVTLNDETGFIARRGRIGIPVSFDNNVNVDLLKYDCFNEKLKEVSESLINPIIDYEKVCFELSGATKLQINIRMRTRERNADGNLYDYDKDDSLTPVWNHVFGDNTVESDTCYDLGFTEDDVYYQKKCLKKSFLRMLFYTRNIPNENNLLGYNTINVNSDKIFKGYLDDVITNWEDFEYTPQIKFVVTNKYNNDYPTEGFYFYTYPSVLDENGEGKVYLKLSFSHAKYGKTIQLSYFNNKAPVENYFDDKEGKVNLKGVYENMYIPILLRKVKDKYYWIPENCEIVDKTIKLTVWEPVINGV